METIKLKGEIRDSFGTSKAKEFRRNGMIPCVLYGGEEIHSFSVKPIEVRPVVYTHKFRTVKLDIAGLEKDAIIKEIQFHPVTDEIVHMDFQELVSGKAVKIAVPVEFTGIKNSQGIFEGGSLIPLLRKVSIKSTPESLVDVLVGDISELGLGQSLKIKDLVIPEGIEVLHDDSSPIAFIETPRSLKSLEDAAAKDDEEEGEGEGEGEEGTAEETTE